jgi:hypothetical protein
VRDKELCPAGCGTPGSPGSSHASSSVSCDAEASTSGVLCIVVLTLTDSAAHAGSDPMLMNIDNDGLD